MNHTMCFWSEYRHETHPAGHRAGSARDDAMQANPSGHGSGDRTPEKGETRTSQARRETDHADRNK